MEGILYEVMTERMKVKNKEYGKMKIHYSSEMYEALEVNIPTNFTINKDTKIYVWDTVNETSKIFNVPELYVDDVNKLHNLEKGHFITQIIRNNSEPEKVMKQNIVLSDVTEEDEFDFDEDEDEHEDDNQQSNSEEEFKDEEDDEFEEEEEEEEEEGDELFDEDMDGSDFEKMLESLS